MHTALDLPPEAFAKADPSPDALFYRAPRFVTHLDDAALDQVTAIYRATLPAGGRVLDLMGSWVSHLPPELAYKEVVGHGMNAAELAANPRLDRWFVQNLNEEPTLPLADGSVDAVTVCASVQYLQQPVAVFTEVARILAPGGAVVVTFANRCFPTKAVAIWRNLDGQGQARLVQAYLEAAGLDYIQATPPAPGRGGDPLWAVTGRRPEVIDK